MSLPSKTSFKGTGFGINQRELILIVGGFFAMLLTLALPFAGLFFRIFLGFSIMAAAVIYAMWRVNGHWTIETWLMQKMRHNAGKKRYVKGYSGSATASSNTYVATEPHPVEKHPEPSDARETPIFRLPSRLTPKTNGELLGYVISTFVLVIMLAWIGTSGLEEIAIQLQQVINGL
jgi:hypothetical protein